MAMTGKRGGEISVDWILRDKDGNIKDSGSLEEGRANGDISE